MSVIKVNNITNRDGTSGPVIAGITTVSSTSHMVVPNGSTGQRVALAPDPYINNLVLALPFNSESVFTDVSPKGNGDCFISGFTATSSLPFGVTGFTSTSSGIQTSTFKYYGSSMFFDGNDDYLTTNVNSNFQLGSENFTIEAWVNYKSGNGSDTPFAIDSPTTTYAPLIGYLDGNLGTPVLYLSSTGSSWDIASNIKFGSAITINQWTHLAVSREGTTIRLFRDGVGVGTITDVGSKSIYQATQQVSIARVQNTVYFDGWVQDLRIYKGVAKYTSNFTPPNQIAL